MIVADTSAILAIQFAEAERDAFLDVVERAGLVLFSSVSVVEARMVVYGRRGHRGVVQMNSFLDSAFFEVVPPGQTEVEAAYSAFVTYGRGSGHPARLNLGDVFSYALAKTRRLPLLFKGDDFSQTDIPSACDPLS